MVHLDTFPYLRPPQDCIRIVEWQLSTGGAMRSLLDVLPDWDPSTPVHVSVRVEGNGARVRADCGLFEDDLLQLVIVWHSPGTTLRGYGAHIDLDEEQADQTITLAVEVGGELLADRIRVEAQLVLARPGQRAVRPAPRRPGSLLWSEGRTIILEGRASRFPVEWVNFAESGWLPEHAAWFLDWDREDLHQMALGSMRLYLNAQERRLRQAVADPSLPESAAIRETIRFDVARAMITGSLDNDEFVRNPEVYEDGSVGTAIRRLIRALMPEQGLSGLQHLRQEAPGRLDALLQDRLKLFTEV